MENREEKRYDILRSGRRDNDDAVWIAQVVTSQIGDI